MEDKDFARIIRDKRKERGLSLAQLGDMSGISASYIYRLEIGERKMPSPEVIERLFTALGIPFDSEKNVSYDEKFEELKKLINMYRKKGDMSIRETIEIMEMVENIVKKKED